jgi:hypothetical protein
VNFRRSRANHEQADNPAPRPARESSRWVTQRALTVGLWVLVAASPVLGVLSFLRPAASAADSVQPIVTPTRWDVAGFAELYVATFVGTGDDNEAALEPFLGREQRPDLSGVKAGQYFASRTTTTTIQSLANGRLRATVATELLRSGPDGYASLGTRYFAVDVVDRGDGALVAAGLPAIVPGPATGSAAHDVWGPAEPPPAGDPLADTVQRFLTALLTGNGELGRYAAPGSELRAVGATFDDVELERWAIRGDDEQRLVQAYVLGYSGTGTARSSMLLVYELTVVQSSGRWEITEIGSPPAAAPSPPSAAPDPTTTTPIQPTMTTHGS